MRRLVLMVMVAVMVVACGPSGSGVSEPPPLTVSADEESLEVVAWSYCWSGVVTSTCADGAPPANPVDVGSPGQVIIEFPHPDWTFDVEFSEVGDECGGRRSATVRPDAEADGTRGMIEPVGPAGTYDVDVFGRGPQGDLAATFRWTTPIDGAAAQQEPESDC